jgi:uncharacterized protein with HEPN domain
MKRDLTDFLEDILAYSKLASEIVGSVNIKTLSEFSMESLALTRCLEIVGEAIKMIPDDVRAKYPEIQWRQAAGLRDILAHQYWSANIALLIETVEKDLPQLRTVVQKILTDLNTEK